ncbi:MAG: GNAT family N-acetyltransferase [Candidatus Izemoplasmatales bacterium]
MLLIKETREKDLDMLMELWNTPSVMMYVGFPNGLNTTKEKMISWFEHIQQKENTKHYSIFLRHQGFMGETYYSFENTNEPAILDIKLFEKGRGKHIGLQAFSFAIDQLFKNTSALSAKVDPHIDNIPAIHLYHKLGFIDEYSFDYQGEKHLYMTLQKSSWQENRIAQVHLEDVTIDNFIEVSKLKLKVEQENFIASNALSLAQSKYQEECIPKAIMVHQNIVGFLMYCVDRTDHEYWIYRLMIDELYQGLGYGQKAMEIILKDLKEVASNHLIRISFEPENVVAKQLYEKLGFQDTGIVDGGEIIYDLKW